VVDLVGDVGVEVPDRVVAHRGQVDHRVEAGEVRGLDVAHVPVNRLDLRLDRPEPAIGEQVVVQADDLVVGALQAGDEDRADVSAMTGDQDAH
jgi:hypothetical protein